MAAALLRSSVALALRRAAAAPASSSSRLSSAAAGTNTKAVRTYYGYGWGSRYDAQAYSHEVFPSQRDKADGYFGVAAFVGTMLFVCLMDGDHFWHRPPNIMPPRMTRGPGR